MLYAGLSNFPAWQLSRAVTLAEVTRSLLIAAAQFEHSLVRREARADLFSTARALRLGIATWSPLGDGVRPAKTGAAKRVGSRPWAARSFSLKTARSAAW
ncbi:aldo/keto reductase [Pseudogemmobacter bohemicus]|uniref:aldo/keto reductase n=1 Tax=Pseudogemmobacter bohemicus TaxID=2250708 RepID=UPI0018E55B9F|nr:aldo/keto reductase [Pseudogemmobacter bohemicus]